MKRLKVLISGFEPFGGEALNPTQTLVESFGDPPPGVELRRVVLPVSFGDAFAKLDRERRAFGPDVVLAFGQAGGRSAIEFERIAVNMIDGAKADNDGRLYRETIIEPGRPTALLSSLPVRELAEHLEKNGVSARVSNSAGLYVCNELFYRLQSSLARSLVRSGFIHVPYLPEQAAAKNAPSMELETMKKGLRHALEFLAK